MKNTLILLGILSFSYVFSQESKLVDKYNNPVSFDNTLKISDLKKIYKSKNYSEKSLQTIANSYNKFRKDSKLDCPSDNFDSKSGSVYLIEYIPGELVGWFHETSCHSGDTENLFLIKGSNIKVVTSEIKDKKFLEKVSEYTTPKCNLNNNISNTKVYPYGEFEKKLKDGNYIFNIDMKCGMSENFDDSKIYTIKYKTKDFQTFTPIKVKENSNDENSKTDWIIIK